MSTYTVTTNFTLKDSLPSGDPAKIIKGVDFGTEFSNISTAINDNVSDINSLELDLQNKAETSAVSSLELALQSKAETSAVNSLELALQSKAETSAVNAITLALQDKVDKTNPATLGTHTHTGSTTITANLQVGASAISGPLFSVDNTSKWAEVSGDFHILDGHDFIMEGDGDLLALGGGDFVWDGGGIFSVEGALKKYFGERVQPFKMQTSLAENWRLLTFTDQGGELAGLSAGNNGGVFCVGSGGVGLGFNTFSNTNYVMPYDFDNNATKADLVNLGTSSASFKNIYLTNSPIISSDENLKQDIRQLTEAEKRVAQACKGLLRAYRWKSRVAEEGDNARIHVGIIAQELKAAFEAEGLDASHYSMFIEGTEDDGQTKKLAVRYEQLLAFVISAL